MGDVFRRDVSCCWRVLEAETPPGGRNPLSLRDCDPYLGITFNVNPSLTPICMTDPHEAACENPFMAQKLGEKISAMATELGTTPDGSAWCLKALHPSDPCVEVRGIPDRSSVPSAFLNYQTLYRLGPDAGTSGTWNFVMQALPNPVTFGWVVKTDALEEGLGSFQAITNTQLSGEGIANKAHAWQTKAERWRLAYAGITIHFDGPALANQGTLVCAQTPYSPRTRTVSYRDPNGNIHAFPRVRFADGQSGPTRGWIRGKDFPSFSSSQSMPNCYLGEAKDGMYIPLKLTKTCQQWHSNADLEMWSVDVSDSAVPESFPATIPKTSTVLSYPHPGLQAVSVSADGATAFGYPVPPMGSDVVANICGRNLSVDSSLVFEFRYGFEVQCEPGTELSPFLRISPQYDPIALKAYSAVSRELKDAYPSDYNDLGKLWDVIRNVARSIGPSLALVPRVGPVLSTVAAAIGGSKPAASEERERAYVAKQVQERLSKPAVVTLNIRSKKGGTQTVSAQRNTGKRKVTSIRRSKV